MRIDLHQGVARLEYSVSYPYPVSARFFDELGAIVAARPAGTPADASARPP